MTLVFCNILFRRCDRSCAYSMCYRKPVADNNFNLYLSLSVILLPSPSRITSRVPSLCHSWPVFRLDGHIFPSQTLNHISLRRPEWCKGRWEGIFFLTHKNGTILDVKRENGLHDEAIHVVRSIRRKISVAEIKLYISAYRLPSIEKLCKIQKEIFLLGYALTDRSYNHKTYNIFNVQVPSAVFQSIRLYISILTATLNSKNPTMSDHSADFEDQFQHQAHIPWPLPFPCTFNLSHNWSTSLFFGRWFWTSLFIG